MLFLVLVACSQDAPPLTAAQEPVVEASAPAPVAQPEDPAQILDRGRFAAVSGGGRIAPRIEDTVAKRDWEVRRALIPPQEEGVMAVLTPEGVFEEVTAFPIGDGRTGLHVMVYAVQAQGSAQAARGRDVFLLLEPESGELVDGLPTVEETHNRGRSGGCLYAMASHFLIADVNGDGLTDLGMVREQLDCPFDPELGMPAGEQRYHQKPVIWFLMKAEGWESTLDHAGELPGDAVPLPLLGIAKTPVDFFAEIAWDSTDPAQWGEQAASPVYTPPYRQEASKPE